MRNFVFTLQPFRSLYSLKTGQYLCCRIFVACDNQIKSLKSFGVRKINRSLYTSGRLFEKQVSGNEENSKSSLIYYGPLTGQIKGLKVFTCVSSLGGIALQPILVLNLINGDNIPVSVALLTVTGLFTFVSPFFIHLLTKKYVTEIQYNSSTDTYTATILSFFLRKINFEFRIEDVTVPNKLPMFATMFIKGKPVFVGESFLEMDHYIKMMGYDKPIDLQLRTVPAAEDFKKSEHKPIQK